MDADTLREIAAKIANLRTDIFCAETPGLSPMAEQLVCIALDSLATARSQILLASYHQMRKE